MSTMVDEQEALFSLADLAPRRRKRSGERVHKLQPNMGFACGRVMLDDECADDRWVMGVYLEADWQRVTCAECRAVGRGEIARLSHLMQKPAGHVCDDTCGPGLDREEAPLTG